jgi:putative membrane protein
MWFGGWWMTLWMLLFWAGLILLVVWGLRAFSPKGYGGDRTDQSRALQILEERFARGEIDRDEFAERRSILEGSYR